MIQQLKHNFLYAAVFLTGASVLIVEIVATRILSPYFGNTIYTVSSVISTILVALSIGYYIGGKWADRKPSLRRFFGIIAVSGLVLLGSHIVGEMLLPGLGFTLSVASGPLVSSILLFLVPAVLLGMLSPFAVKLQTLSVPEEGIGSVAGKMFFWSTFGSIVGSLSAGFVLIPHVGIDQIIIANGVLLFCLGFGPLLWLGTRKKYLKTFAVLFVVLTGFAWVVVGASDAQGDTLYEKDGLYEKITIYDSEHQGRPTRFFKQDRSSSGAMFLDTDDPADLVYEYTKYYRLHRLFVPEVTDALVIGGGAYSIPKALLHELPGATVDVSEIEPSLLELSKQYFGVQDTPRLRTFTEDGRRMLKDADREYDLIFSDVYYSYYSVPSHFTTSEFFQVAKERLADDGLFVASMIGDLSRREPSLIMSEFKTFREVFPNSYFFATKSPGQTGIQNIILVGHNSTERLDLGSLDLRDEQDELLRDIQSNVIDPDRFELSPYPTLTDNYAPVDYLTTQVLHRRSQETALNGEEMLALIRQQLRYGPRHLGAPGHDKIRDLLAAELRAIGADTRLQTWQHKDGLGDVHELSNVIGRLHPERPRRIVLGTHYDTKKHADKDGSDQPVPGANDGASGVAVLLELARAAGGIGLPEDVGLDVVFFDGEEGEPFIRSEYDQWQPLGSTYFARHLSSLYGNNKPEAGIIVDMVCDKDLELTREASSADHAAQFWETGAAKYPGVFRQDVRTAISDDHTPLNRAGIPSFLIIDFDYPAFHTAEDTADKCSADSLETVAGSLASYLTTL